jgi:hypothetical protein
VERLDPFTPVNDPPEVRTRSRDYIVFKRAAERVAF